MKFVDYLKSTLLPALKPGDIVSLHAATVNNSDVCYSKETGLCYRTVTKYLKTDYIPSHNCYGVSDASPLKPFADKIRQALTQGLEFREIEQAIREDEYQGASSTIRMFASRERRLLKQVWKKQGESMETVGRKALIGLLYKPLEDVKGITGEQLKKITERFPIVSILLDYVIAFKEIRKAGNMDEQNGKTLRTGTGRFSQWASAGYDCRQKRHCGGLQQRSCGRQQN